MTHDLDHLAAILDADEAARAHGDLGTWMQRTLGADGYKHPRHLRPLLDALQRSLREPQLILCAAPPGHGKSSTLLSYLIWCLQRDPKENILYASYGDALSREQAWRARTFADRAGLRIEPDRSAITDWKLVDGGGAYFAGAGAGITGRRFKRIVIDDPHKGQAEAESETIRQTVINWFRTDAYSRLEPGGTVVVTMTRWHMFDLYGALAEQTDPAWTQIHLPAICDEDHDLLGRAMGEALWPDRWPVEALARFRAQGEREWNALWQGRPSPREGAMIKREWLAHRFDPEGPAEYRYIVMAVDSAWGESATSDFNVVVTAALAPDGYRILDLWRDRCDYPTLERRIVEQAQRFRTNAILIEANSAGQACLQTLRRCTPLPLIGVKPRASKESRVAATLGLWEAGKVRLPAGAGWVPVFVEEAANFPHGTAHDDQVDAATMALDRLAQVAHGQVQDAFHFGHRNPLENELALMRARRWFRR